MPQQLPGLTQQLQKIIAANSISSSNAHLDQGNREVIDLLADWLSQLGFSIDIMPMEHPGKANLIATLGSGPGGLVLAGHTDTVPCDEHLWQQDPFSLVEKDNRFYGLGTCDMKGFFPLVIEAARKFSDQKLKQPLIILATADEESSMCGAIALAKAGKPKARYAVIGEPTGLKPVSMHKGIMVEKLVITGRSGHSSDPSLGVNAMESMNKALTELLTFRDELKTRHNNASFAISYPTMNLGCIHGGNNPNRICGHCELGFEIRPLPGMDIQKLHGELEQRLRNVLGSEATSFKLEHYGLPPFQLNPESELLALCEKIAGKSAESVSFATEAPYLQSLGMDVMVLGPGDVSEAHQPNEFLALDRINPTVDMLGQLIGRCCL